MRSSHAGHVHVRILAGERLPPRDRSLRAAAVSASADLLVPGGIHLFEHLVDRLLTGQQALDADAERVVDGRVRPRGVRAGPRTRRVSSSSPIGS